MSKGGSRKHPANCACGNCPRIGRPKAERATSNKVAGQVLKEVNAKAKWLRIIELASEKAEGTKNTADLQNALKYLEDREYGKTVDTVNHLHDKPLQIEATVSIAEVVREVRQRKQEYERSGR